MPLRLRLQSWQVHEDLDIVTSQPVTLLTGSNASGKTAIRDGLEFVLAGTGLLRGVRTKGDLALYAIRDDAKQTAVELTIPGTPIDYGRTMDRQATQAIRVGRRDLKVSKGDAIIWTQLGLEPERIRAALDAGPALGGDDKARRTLLVAAAGAEAQRDDVAKALESTGLDGEAIGRLTDLAIADGFPDAQRTAESERAARTRQIRDSGPGDPDPIYTPEWTTTAVDLSDLSLPTLRKRQADLEARVGEAQRSEGVDIGVLQAAQTTARERHAALIEEGDEMLDATEGPYTLEQLGETARLGREAATANETFRAGMAERVRDLRAQASALDDLGEIVAPDPCPQIVGGPKCPMTPKRLEAHGVKLTARRDSIVSDLRDAEEHLAAAETAAQTSEAEAVGAESARDIRQVAEERMEAIKGELDECESAIAEAGVRLARAEQETTEERPSGPDFYQTRLDHVRSLIETKRSYDQQVQQAAVGAATRISVEQQRTAWDRAAKLLAPDGLPTRLFAARIASLQSYIDEIGIAEIRLTAQAEFEAQVEGRWRRWQQLSESWQLRVSIVASHVLARAAGFPILIADRFDHLDPPGRQAVIAGLRRVAPHYPGGVLVLATLGKPEPQATGLDGVETLWLHDHGIERIG